MWVPFAHATWTNVVMRLNSKCLVSDYRAEGSGSFELDRTVRRLHLSEAIGNCQINMGGNYGEEDR